MGEDGRVVGFSAPSAPNALATDLPSLSARVELGKLVWSFPLLASNDSISPAHAQPGNHGKAPSVMEDPWRKAQPSPAATSDHRSRPKSLTLQWSQWRVSINQT